MLFFLIAIIFFILIVLFIIYSILKYINRKDWPKNWTQLPYSMDDVIAAFRLKKEANKEDKPKNE
jgi:hypothetical protein